MQNKRPSGAPTAAPGAPGTFSAQDAHLSMPLPPPDVPVARGRSKKLRSRLVVGVAVVALIVTGAGAPGLLDSSSELHDSQRLVTLAELNRQAVTLAHALADERDEVTAYIAAGREGGPGDRQKAVTAPAVRVDRQIEEIRGSIPDERAALRRDLATVPTVRRSALGGKGTALEAYNAYTTVINGLHALAGELAEKTPPRAADGARAHADLGLAVEQASATRGLLLAALAVPAADPDHSGGGQDGSGQQDQSGQQGQQGQYGQSGDEESEEQKAAARARDALSALALQARVREEAALADFDQDAAKSARDSLLATVTGAEVKAAEAYLSRLTDEPQLSGKDRETDPRKLAAALTARIEQMRGVESALAAQRITAFEQLRDDDVTELELRIAVLGGLLLLAVAVLAALLRTITRPLSVLRRGAARLAGAPEAEEPVGFTGRNDEFAQTVRSLNTLHGKVRELAERARGLDSARGGLAAERDALAAELATARADAHRRTVELTADVERLRHSVEHTFVNLSLRNLGLVDRQLSVIEKLEEREQDPERLATLFKLDHMATVMRRHSENLLVLAGAEHSHGHPGAVPLVDVLRAAVSEIERYERVVIQSLPPQTQVAGFAADDLSHLVAELLENATSFSPPEARVELSGWLLENGEVMLSVQDTGIGMTAGRLAELNEKLENPLSFEEPAESADPATDGRATGPDGSNGNDGDTAGVPADRASRKNGKNAKGGKAGKNGKAAGRNGKNGRASEPEGLGLRVTALLAARHGVRVQLRDQKQGGITAVVVLPMALLPQGARTELRDPLTDSGSMPAVRLPGSVAEANSNALPAGSRQATVRPGTDPDSGTAPEPGTAAAAGNASVPAPAAPADAAPPAPPALPVRSGGQRTTGAYGSGPAGPVPVPQPSFAEPLTDPLVEAAEAAVRAAEPEVHGRTADGDPVVAGIDEPTFEMRLPDLGADPADRTAPAEPAAAAPAGPAAPVWDRVTDKGLPKRTPKVVRPATDPGERRSGGVDPAELRRRLGGFQKAAEDGRREAQAEIARTAAPEEAGDTVEEARS
ncbi:nitrate- and nitrite sensing domain-containing protein [Streptomyces tsukubensis]